MAYLDNRDSARLGKAVELLVAAMCMLTSQLRLNVATTFVDDEGVDLVFSERGHPETLAVQVKSRRTAGAQMQRSQFIANVADSTFEARSDFYLLFVSVNADRGELVDVWFVPSRDFSRVQTTVTTQGRRQFRASTKPDSQDRWSRFRCSPPELSERIIQALQARRAYNAADDRYTYGPGPRDAP